MSFSELAFLVCTFSSLAGIALIWWGRRGKLVGDHLHCAQCEYDLHGAPHDASRCPECGALIRYGRARGTHKPNRRMLLAGQCILPVALLGLGSVVYTEVRKFNWVTHEPLWYVLDFINLSAASPAGTEHLDELDRRISLKFLSSQEMSSVSATLTHYQLDKSAPWNFRIGTMIERLYGAGSISTAAWAQYELAGVETTLKVRAYTHTGDPIGAALMVKGVRYGMWSGQATLHVNRVMIDGQPVPAAADEIGLIARGKQLRVPIGIDAKLQPGEHEVAIEYALTVGSGATSREPQTLRQQIKIGDDQPTLQANASAGLKHVFGSSDLGLDWRPGAHWPRVRQPRSGGAAVVEFNFSRATPEPDGQAMAYDIFLVENGNEQRLGSFCRQTSDPSANLTFPWNGGPYINAVDIILRPRREYALPDPEIEQWIDTEYTFKGVRVML